MSHKPCHYEVLRLSREAGPAEVKKAYKKLALSWHPVSSFLSFSSQKKSVLFVLYLIMTNGFTGLSYRHEYLPQVRCLSMALIDGIIDFPPHMTAMPNHISLLLLIAAATGCRD